MVYINDKCSNSTGEPGKYGGGARCVCPKCQEERSYKLNKEIEEYFLSTSHFMKGKKMVPQSEADHWKRKYEEVLADNKALYKMIRQEEPEPPKKLSVSMDDKWIVPEGK